MHEPNILPETERQVRPLVALEPEEYCRLRWHMSRMQASRLIGATEVATNLSPIGYKLPGNVEQTRPLAYVQDAG